MVFVLIRRIRVVQLTIKPFKLFSSDLQVALLVYSALFEPWYYYIV